MAPKAAIDRASGATVAVRCRRRYGTKTMFAPTVPTMVTVTPAVIRAVGSQLFISTSDNPRDAILCRA